METKKQETGVALPQKAQALVPFPEIQSIAQAFMESGLFPGIVKQAQAVVKIVAGQEMGFPPMFSMQNIDIVKGRVHLRSQLIAALIKRSGRYDYKVSSLTNTECTLIFTDDGKDVWKSIFTIGDAQRAGLVRPDSSWVTYPQNMLFARALSQGAKIVCPHLMAGAETLEDAGYEEVNGEITKEGEPPPSAWRAFWVEAKEIVLREDEPQTPGVVEERVHMGLGVASVKDWLTKGHTFVEALDILRQGYLSKKAEGVKEPEMPPAVEASEPPSGQYKSTIYLISVEKQDEIRTLAHALGIKVGKEFDQVKWDACGRVVNLSEMTAEEGDKIILHLMTLKEKADAK